MRWSRLLIRKIRTASSLPREQVWSIARAWLALLRVQFSLDVLPYRYWQKRLNAAINKNHDGSPNVTKQQECRQIAQDVAIAARNHFLKVNCLGRSLALHGLCHRAGATTQIAIGIRKNRDNIEGHAWLEADGVVLNDTIESIGAFTKLYRLPSFPPTFVNQIPGRWVGNGSMR